MMSCCIKNLCSCFVRIWNTIKAIVAGINLIYQILFIGMIVTFLFIVTSYLMMLPIDGTWVTYAMNGIHTLRIPDIPWK